MASPVIAHPQAVDVTLSLFGGTDTEISPSDVPEGLSPDNQDMIFLPGNTSSRPGMKKLFNAAFPDGVSVFYEKTYVQPNKLWLTLVLTSDGKLWVEDVTNNPGVATSPFSVAPGLYGQSITDFGREYIAFSDLLHGQGVPLQYDGTNLDRVTMDGPGAAPSFSNQVQQAVAVSNSGTGAPVNLATATPSDGHTYTPPDGGDPFTLFRSLTVVTSGGAHGLTQGEYTTLAGITGGTNLNGLKQVTQVINTTTFKVQYYGTDPTQGTGGTETPQSPSLVRNNNVVTAVTGSAHGFSVGWQVQISGIANTAIGGGISSISRDANGVVTVVTANPHGLSEDCTIAINGVNNPDASFNGTFPVNSIVGPNTFTYLQGGTAESSGAGTGNVQDIWTATAFIQSVPTATSFTYSQIGPNDFTNASGTATIIGQVSPGIHLATVMWLTRQGNITRPAPYVQFSANGGQQCAVDNLPIGPANVVARILSFTGAGGDNFFTQIVTPQVAGQITGTSLIIADNTTTSTVVDFSDNTLFAGIPIDVVGNDLFDQVVLGPVLGFFGYASRLAAWGDWAKIENFVNLGFCGGYLSGFLTTPLGWTVDTAGGALVNGGSWPSGMSWQITGDGSGNPKGRITQPAFQDVFGDPILSASTSYLLRIWAKASVAHLNGSIVVDFYDPANLAVLASAVIPIANASTSGGFLQVAFNQATPSTIPADTVLRVSTIGSNNLARVTLGEVNVVFAQNPYRNNLSRWSYALNPEAFAQTTGNLSPADDSSPLQNFSIQKNVGLLHTGEACHEFQDNNFEPGDGSNSWPINALTHSVGALSLKSCDPGKFGTGDSAEDWDLIASKNGLYLHLGAQFYKVSQEYSRTLGTAPSAFTWDDINWAAQQTIWVKNDVNQRRALVGVPLGNSLTPNAIFSFDYREMDTAAQIASALPIHITLTGKMKSSDMTRKWTRWNISAACGEVLVRPGNQKTLFLGGGVNSQGAAFGNIYSLDPAKLTDDDYGQMFPYYTTFAFVDHDQEQMFQLGSGRHLYPHIQGFIAGVGLVTITPYVNSLNNPLPPTSPRLLRSDADQGTAQPFDLEWTTGIRGQRVFFKIAVQPLPGTTDVQMKLQKLIVTMMKDPVAMFRGSRV